MVRSSRVGTKRDETRIKADETIMNRMSGRPTCGFGCIGSPPGGIVQDQVIAQFRPTSPRCVGGRGAAPVPWPLLDSEQCLMLDKASPSPRSLHALGSAPRCNIECFFRYTAPANQTSQRTHPLASESKAISLCFHRLAHEACVARFL